MNPITILALICLCLLLAILIISAFENRSLVVTSYTVASEKLPQAFDGCKFVVLADLHNRSYWDKNQRLLNLIREANPEFVILAGDMIVANDEGHSTSAISLIRALADTYPVFYSNGNHELEMMCNTKDPKRFARYKEGLGDQVIWLNNRTAILRRDKEQKISWEFEDISGKSKSKDDRDCRVLLHGLDLPKRYYKRGHLPELKTETLDELLGAGKDDVYRMLIAHHPDYFPTYARWGADLVFAGHIHGGMIRLPGIGGMIAPTVHIFPKYSRGRYETENRVMLLSGGLGSHTLRFRVNNPPELLVVTLAKGS